MPNPAPLQYGCYYHIYNRGNNRENLFLEERNYRHFLRLYAYYIEPIADTYAYCLLKNHFHVLVRIKTVAEQAQQQMEPVASDQAHALSPSRQFSNLFNAYTKAINAAYGRTGNLFERPFERVEVTSERYLSRLVTYIHRNPQQHGLIADFRAWPYSSYQSLYSNRATRVRRDAVIGWFGGPTQVELAHQVSHFDHQLTPLILENFDS